MLPEEFSRDKERLARFEREAKVLAALNHPNIASIYGVEEQDGVHALVLELVDGPTLADRIAEGPTSIEEAAAIAKQITEALEAAHERGIVHRDLKPANVKVRDDGTVKVLDFGLAKALEGDRTDGAAAELSQSPTLSRHGTAAGVILGTAAYMSPEQARGNAVDTRTDVWAFGVVMYEMLVGRRLFSGETVSDVLAAVLRDELEWSKLPAETPEPLRRLLRRCVTREPARRLPHIGAARLEIEDAFASSDEPTPIAKTRRHPVNTIIAASLALLAAVAVFTVLRDTPPLPPPIRANIDLPAGTQLAFGPKARSSIAISRDGSTLAFVTAPLGSSFDFSSDAWTSHDTRIYVKQLDTGETTALPDTDGAFHVFFSPDGSHIGFFGQGELKTIAVTGGAPVSLCPATNPWGATWTEDDRIVFADLGVSELGLLTVSAEGGEPAAYSTPDESRGERDHSFPESIPGSNNLLITMWAGGVYPDASVGLLSSAGEPARHLLEGGSHAKLLLDRYLVYARSPRLLAIPFDARSGRVTGNPEVIVDGVLAEPLWHTPQIALSPSGVLVWAAGGVAGSGRLWRIDPDTEPPRFERLLHDVVTRQGRMFPGGNIVAIDSIEENANVIAYDLDADTAQQMTSSLRDDSFAVPSPAGDAIFYASTTELSVVRHELTRRDAEIIWTPPGAIRLNSVSADGRFLAYSVSAGRREGRDIGVLDLESGAPGRNIIATSAMERDPAFSPTELILAYESNLGARGEIVMQRFDPDADAPSNESPLQVSRGGGTDPFWSSDGRTLYFAGGDRLMAASISTTPDLAATRPAEVLLLGPDVLEPHGIGIVEVFGQDRDGRFLAIAFPPITSVTQLEAIFHWQP